MTEKDPSPGKDVDRTEEFVRLLGQTQRYRFAYMMSLTNNREVTEELLQETNLVLWREFENFELGTNFTAWSCRVAFNQLRAWRKKQQRSRLKFSDEFLEAVAGELEAASDRSDERVHCLQGCVALLPEHHRQLIQYRYTAGESIETIAERTGKSLDSVYRMLSRIREKLRDCVSEKMTLGESS